ncbi:TPA: site-specific DNA-methyltransferase [Clostridium botulinum]|nr:site-specific DNA-methyltransferase [Clostridium botulinum]NFB58798.1 site-specific DNA-methyltransferase [Clostridium botulinum]HDK7179329.1 site-specific DNA-methyltransferase [Clostridium botulinum]HDK7190531.1 site-specific DNA-methyltransferase [Clostridium botulinum]HDK7224961.1 site-specific DNA-methyltransferase [Clostridium botulinum]
MALLQDLIQQIEDPALRDRILKETNKLVKQKKFGLVFEDHLPECTPLYDVSILVGSKVSLKSGKVNDFYVVLKIDGEEALCDHRETHEKKTFALNELVAIAEFGEPIYPTLKLIDYVENASDSDLWHALIEADNYHALQLLEYLYAGKVDCIYIDPPYNTGARDWKYNNDYVDSSDAYRHSKWLSMMEKRLKLAKKLLNPDDSILMITIDDIELCHLRVLIESIFPECNLQIVDMFINPKGKARVGRLSQVDEYLILVYMGSAATIPDRNSDSAEEIRWPYLRRSDVESARGTTKGGTQQFYPIYVDVKTEKIVELGAALSPEQPLSDAKKIDGAVAVFPIREDGKHMNWGLTGESLKYAIENGCVRVSKGKNKYQPYNFAYVTMPSIKKALSGEYNISGVKEDGTKIITLPNGSEHQKPTAWKETHYDANAYGTKLIGKMLGEKRFSFPKSLYSVLDALRIYLSGKPQALVVDFFAGSGTTLHAVNLLNEMDDGHRRCIMVTNNEVSEVEAKTFEEEGKHPGEDSWEKYGIARYVTWPRTVCSIKGVDINGKKLNGRYGITKEEYYSEKVNILNENGKSKMKTVFLKKKVQVYPELMGVKMSDGFPTNAAFFKLSFLDKTSIALGRQFKELLPVLWMKGGAVGKCPVLETSELPHMLVLPENKMAVLIDEIYYPEFDTKLNEHPEIPTVFIVTDSESAYREMIRSYDNKNCYQLYRDYLDNFRINTGR